ncbi:related to non-heme chloroperoxidase [Rhynchosporium graminicola]|uniref:Related to non-heme chloroperoxidase n=1 Tax=Rhynchosporium graminicola TaxID=2792576 RepID=A0A1E1LA97_9HELO|nr:related to non-heme chloroperoxidase [Rhynchosporium commune]
MIHGWSGSALVWQRNIPAFAAHYRVIVPDLRGHGASGKPDHGFQVSRLAMDLKELVDHVQDKERLELEAMGNGTDSRKSEWRAIGGSLGCAILWCYASLFTTTPFTHKIFVDQSPLQNLIPSDWTLTHCNRGLNSPSSLLSLQNTLATSPKDAHLGSISSCLAYLAYPSPDDFEKISPETRKEDSEFFLGQAMRCNQVWLGRLMGDHTALDWRSSIAATFGPRGSQKRPKVLVVASERSGCFPAAGPLYVVELARGENGEGEKERVRGVSVSWGGHWCYWEDPEQFNKLCLEFLDEKEMVKDGGSGGRVGGKGRGLL